MAENGARHLHASAQKARAPAGLSSGMDLVFCKAKPSKPEISKEQMAKEKAWQLFEQASRLANGRRLDNATKSFISFDCQEWFGLFPMQANFSEKHAEVLGNLVCSCRNLKGLESILNMLAEIRPHYAQHPEVLDRLCSEIETWARPRNYQNFVAKVRFHKEPVCGKPITKPLYADTVIDRIGDGGFFVQEIRALRPCGIQVVGYESAGNREEICVDLKKLWTRGRILKYIFMPIASLAAAWGIAYFAGYPPPQRFLSESQRTEFNQLMDECRKFPLNKEYPDADESWRKRVLCAEEQYRKRHE